MCCHLAPRLRGQVKSVPLLRKRARARGVHVQPVNNDRHAPGIVGSLYAVYTAAIFGVVERIQNYAR